MKSIEITLLEKDYINGLKSRKRVNGLVYDYHAVT